MKGCGKMEAALPLVMNILMKEERERVRAKKRIPELQIMSYMREFELEVSKNEAALQRCMRRANPLMIAAQVREPRLSVKDFKAVFCEFLPESHFFLQEDFKPKEDDENGDD